MIQMFDVVTFRSLPNLKAYFLILKIAFQSSNFPLQNANKYFEAHTVKKNDLLLISCKYGDLNPHKSLGYLFFFPFRKGS